MKELQPLLLAYVASSSVFTNTRATTLLVPHLLGLWSSHYHVCNWGGLHLLHLLYAELTFFYAVHRIIVIGRTIYFPLLHLLYAELTFYYAVHRIIVIGRTIYFSDDWIKLIYFYILIDLHELVVFLYLDLHELAVFSQIPGPMEALGCHLTVCYID